MLNLTVRVQNLRLRTHRDVCKNHLHKLHFMNLTFFDGASLI